MNGEELYNKLSERDYSGSEADEYAQLLRTIHHHLSGSGELSAFYKALEQAEAEGKKIDLVEQDVDEILFSNLVAI